MPTRVANARHDRYESNHYSPFHPPKDLGTQLGSLLVLLQGTLPGNGRYKYMKAIAKGFVLSVENRSFWVRLYREDHVLEAEIDRRKLSPRERPFLCVGAYVSILKGGSIRFSRERWRRQELKDAKRAQVITEFLASCAD